MCDMRLELGAERRVVLADLLALAAQIKRSQEQVRARRRDVGMGTDVTLPEGQRAARGRDDDIAATGNPDSPRSA